MDADRRANVVHHRQQVSSGRLAGLRRHRHARERLAAVVAHRGRPGVGRDVVDELLVGHVVEHGLGLVFGSAAATSSRGGAIFPFSIALSASRHFRPRPQRIQLRPQLHVGGRLHGVGDVLLGLVLEFAAAMPEVLQLLPVDGGQRLDRVDVERAQLGPLALGQERDMRQRLCLIAVCAACSLNCSYCRRNRSA